MERYGTDRPDTRFEMELVDLTEVAAATSPFPGEAEMFTSVSKDRGLI